MNELAKKIETLLFVGGEGMSVTSLAGHLKVSDDAVITALAELEEHLAEHHALVLVRLGDRVSMATGPVVSSTVEDFAKEEFGGELTKAALETLAIVAYKGPVRRAEIDYVRGVNSSFMLRNLLMRGLIERKRDTHHTRWYQYAVSADFLKFLGFASLADLPDYGAFATKLEAFMDASTDHNA